ncbi:HNH endonuclease family protein [Kibdelosporangium persicum]|uniref:HNH endonuclease n=1 Tax=Kibdelosporangium persicum TaxID=2698649 RepID=A0ABX2EVF7_9PSEU|nr:HNH endonuclease family protein [Kibdelosporangium persicum]NRN62959.1 HNH endonuclease [Kibdelosporangium persicum]
MSRTRHSTVAAVGAVALLLVLAVAFWWLNRAESAALPPESADLQSLKVAPPGPMSGYSRDRFSHWAGNGDSCDTREIVLQRQGAQVQRDAQCRAVSGKWVSPYDGVELTKAADIDIDHMVPLAEAWRSGASTWTDEKRKQFANDLGNPQLFAVTAAANRSKGDQDPGTWKPPVRAYWCTYAKNYVAVKAFYQLTVDTKERDALATMLATC